MDDQVIKTWVITKPSHKWRPIDVEKKGHNFQMNVNLYSGAVAVSL